MTEKNRYEAFEGFKNPETDIGVLRDKRNVRRTQSLFIEMNNDEKKYPSLYTMKTRDRDGLISAYQVFMHSVNEREAALKLVGDYEHWDKLCELQWFKEGSTAKGFTGILQWRKDMQERDLTLAKETLLYNAKTRCDVSAARALIAMYKEPKPVKNSQPKTTPQDEAKKEKQNKIAELHAARLAKQRKDV